LPKEWAYLSERYLKRLSITIKKGDFVLFVPDSQDEVENPSFYWYARVDEFLKGDTVAITWFDDWYSNNLL